MDSLNTRDRRAEGPASMKSSILIITRFLYFFSAH